MITFCDKSRGSIDLVAVYLKKRYYQSIVIRGLQLFLWSCLEQIAENKPTAIDALKKEAPLMYKQLAEDAEQDQESIEDYLKNWDQPLEFFYDLVKYSQDEINKAKQRPLILEIARTAQNNRAILRRTIMRCTG